MIVQYIRALNLNVLILRKLNLTLNYKKIEGAIKNGKPEKQSIVETRRTKQSTQHR